VIKGLSKKKLTLSEIMSTYCGGFKKNKYLKYYDFLFYYTNDYN